LGDKPSKEAVMTLGGEEGEDNTQKNRGVLGLYLGNKFPRVGRDPLPGQPHKREIIVDEVPRNDLWAWWAGTSFASPIVTGAIAAVFGTGIARTTKEAVQALKGDQKTIKIIEEARTDSDKDVMYVKQG
jgi:subtilisin family serine protease